MKPLISRNPIFCFLTRAFYYVIVVPILAGVDSLVFGLKIRGRKNIRGLKGKGAILVCNHVHELDCSFLGLLCVPRKIVFTSMEVIFSWPVIGRLIHILGSVPVPASLSGMRHFFSELALAAQNGRLVCLYPEGELIRYCNELRPFKDGAFILAAKSKAPVVPVMISQRERAGLWKIMKRRPCLTLIAGEPIYPDSQLGIRQAAHELSDKAFRKMSEMQLPPKENAAKRSA